MAHWREWTDRTLDEAHASARPILLYVKAAWCRWCREFEREVLADPRVSATIEAYFTPVIIDGERRPDLAARFSNGGRPTLAYLDERGELLTSDGYLAVDELLARLDLVAGRWTERGALRRLISEAGDESHDDGAAGCRGASGSVELSNEVLRDVAQRLLETSDPQFGGWGAAQKFPHPHALDLVLARWSQTGDEALARLVLRTLRCMQAGEIHDRVEGGFYRYCAAPDWSAPDYEKLLDGNAQRLHAYLEAYQAFGDESFAATARSVIDWLHSTLLDRETGAFRGSQDADPLYARRTSLAERRARGAPPCDSTVFADWNAMAASALLRASVVLERPDCEASALAALRFVLDEMSDERSGVHHYFDGARHLPGMLGDQAFVLRALLDAAQFAGRTDLLEQATGLAQASVATLGCENGGFWDTRSDPGARGALRRRTRPLLENSILAEGLLRLAHMTGESRWRQCAMRTLGVFANDYKRAGHEAASYARAVDLALNPPVHVLIVGEADAQDTRALRLAALRPYVVRRVVQTLDVERDARWIEVLGLPAPVGVAARAFVSRGRESYAETADSSRLPALMTRVEPAA